MSTRSLLARWASRTVVAAVFAWAGGPAPAADVTAPPPAVVGAAPAAAGEMPGCAACEHGAPAGGHCATCGKWFTGGHLHKDKKALYPVTLCPGSCFGYFQTQWRKWDEVCPYPYLGVGVGDAPRAPGAPGPRPGELSPPRPLDPKLTDPKMPDPKKVGSKAGSNAGSTYSSYFPAIPVAPAPSKFAP